VTKRFPLEAAMQAGQMTTPFDYDSNPERFRLATKMSRSHLTISRSLHTAIAEALIRAEATLVLDIGCGEGALRAAMPTPSSARIVGLDASETMLRAHPPPVVQADATALPFNADTFDAAVAVNMLDHLSDPTAAIREAHRVLAPGGMFVAATVSRHDSPELAHVWQPTPSTFDAEDAPELVASVFGRSNVERWDAPLIRLPDRVAVRDYLIGRHVSPDIATAAADKVKTPRTITKRGAVVYARK
jgi:SAM-dependent methyltransferase